MNCILILQDWKTKFDPKNTGSVNLDDVCDQLGLDPETM
jgi:hypothetical protein